MPVARVFDYDVARHLRAQGMTYTEIARRLGVSSTAVQRACDPAIRQRMQRQTSAYLRDARRPCLDCGEVLVWHIVGGRSGLCQRCVAKRRFAADIRPTELRCRQCGRWKADDQFPRDSRGQHARRGRRSQCRACETARRTANRAANVERDRATDRRSKRNRKEVVENVSTFEVVRQTGDGRWETVTTVEAASAMNAVEKGADQEGIFAAFSRAAIHEVKPVQRLTVSKIKPEA